MNFFIDRVNIFARFGMHDQVAGGKFMLNSGNIHIHPEYMDNSDGSDQNMDFCLVKFDTSIFAEAANECDDVIFKYQSEC